MHIGDGMSSKHGNSTKDQVDSMYSTSSSTAFQTAAACSNTTELALTPWTKSACREKQHIKKQTAGLVTSEKPGSKNFSPDDFLSIFEGDGGY